MIGKQTTLDLNGPILSFIQQPSSVSIVDNSSTTFVGIATATFPTQDPTNSASNTGSISYRWYDQNGPLSNGTNITGTATTTLSLSNLRNSTDNGRRFYLTADYIPSAYGLTGVAVTVGSARSTGNAVNDFLTSNTATLTVFSNISIVSQPSSSIVPQNTNTTFSVSAGLSDGTQTGLSYRWIFNGTDLSDGTGIPGLVVSGSGTPNLTISSSVVSSNSIRVRITHPTAGNSPVFSEIANFSVVAPRKILNVELVPANGADATLYTWNLASQGQFSIGPNEIPEPDVMSFYSSETNLDVFIDISANAGRDVGVYKGGQGGMSTIRLTLEKNIEYVITNIIGENLGSAIYFHRKSRLIACVGGGGNAGTDGNGGNGGGVNVAGANGSGRGAGTGGVLYAAGTLPSNGIFGSTVNNSPSFIRPGDSQASIPNGGRILPCPKGAYWNTQYSACEDIGNKKFRVQNGTESPNTAVISRGFKAGYGIRQTAGAGTNGGGNGGNGATGGNGGTNGGGGGGGSGYTDGSVTVVSTRQGGNPYAGRIIIRSAT